MQEEMCIAEPLSGATFTELSLPDIDLSGIPTRLRNVLRFVAGLTKFDGIPLASLQPLVLSKKFSKTKMTLKSLHWLFEAQCTDLYNEMGSSSLQLQFSGISTMSPFDCFVLGFAIAHITSHWKIILNGTHIGNEGVEMLVAGMNFDRDNFTQSDYSVSLDLDDCDITSEGLNYLNKIPTHVSQNMTELRLPHNRFGDAGAIRLAELLKENWTLKQLSVCDSSIGQGGAIALAEILRENRTLQLLYVNNNFLGQGGATALAEVLKENTTLQQLHIKDNSIGQVGATALARMLEENRTLQWLDVSFNSIGQGGATALAEMLKENTTLQWLDVSNNSICQGGATTLAEIVKKYNTLKSLFFFDNPIGEEGTAILIESLKYNTTLEQLGLPAKYELLWSDHENIRILWL